RGASSPLCRTIESQGRDRGSAASTAPVSPAGAGAYTTSDVGIWDGSATHRTAGRQRFRTATTSAFHTVDRGTPRQKQPAEYHYPLGNHWPAESLKSLLSQDSPLYLVVVTPLGTHYVAYPVLSGSIV